MNKLIGKARILFIPCEENNYKPRFLESQFLFHYILVLLILKIIAVAFIYCFPKTVFFADLTKTALIQLTNQERQSLGLPILKENPILNQAAYQKAQDMLALDYFSHYSPTGLSPWYWFKKAGYNYQLAGENLAIGFLDSEEVIRAWKNSPSHKANLLNPKFKEIGIAVLKGDFQGSETTLVVQLFGSPIEKTAMLGEEKTQEINQPKIEKEILLPTFTESQVTEIPSDESKEKEEIGEKAITEKPVIEKITAGVSEFQLTTFQPQTQKEKLSFLFFKFMVLKYPDILQKVIFYSLLFITLALILNIFIKIHIQDRKLIIKTAIFILLLVLFTLSDKELIINLIPHNLLI